MLPHGRAISFGSERKRDYGLGKILVYGAGDSTAYLLPRLCPVGAEDRRGRDLQGMPFAQPE